MKKTLIYCLLLLVLLSGCGSSSSDSYYADGTYTTSAEGNNGPVEVVTTIASGKISAVTISSHSETAGISDGAIEQIPAAIVKANSADVDLVSGATYTSNAIVKAVKEALTQAEAAKE